MHGNLYTGEGTLPIVPLAISSKLSGWGKEKSCFSKKLTKKLINHLTSGSAPSPLYRFPWITAAFL